MAYNWSSFGKSDKMSKVKQSYWGNSKVPIPKQRNDDDRLGVPVTKAPKSGMMHFKEMVFQNARKKALVETTKDDAARDLGMTREEFDSEFY